MDEETQQAIESINLQIQALGALFHDQVRRLDAVQDLAVTVSAFARMTEKALTNHLDALAVAVAEEPSVKPAKRGPEVG